MIFVSVGLFADSWDNITSTLNPTDIFIKNNYIYVSTNGGILISDTWSFNFETLDFDDGIYPLDIISVYIDSRENVLLGGNSPYASIQVLNSSNHPINTVFLDGITSVSSISNIIEFNNSIYSIGLGLESDKLIEYRYDEDGKLYYQTIVNNLPIQNISKIYDLDIYYQNGSDNLIITTNKGIVEGVIINNEIAWNIVSENDADKTFFNNGSIFTNSFKGEEVKEVFSNNSYNEFNIMTDKSLYNIVDLDTVKVFESPHELASFSSIFRLENLVVLGVENMGIYSFLLEGNSFQAKSIYVPETIIQNKFTALTVTSSGDVVALSDNGGAIISESKITNFVPYNKRANYPVNNYFDDISSIDQFIQNIFFRGFSRNYRSGMQSPLSVIESNWNSIYFTNPGITPDESNVYNSPLVEINLNNYEFSNYGIGDGVVDGMDGIVDIDSEGTNYMVPNYLDKDKHGNVWVLNPFSENYNHIIAIQNSNKDWYHLKDRHGLDSSFDNNSLLPTSFDFGPKGRVWFSFRKYYNQNDVLVSSGGVKILDYNNTIEDTSDDIWLEIDSSDIFPGGDNVDIWSIAFSKNLEEDILWILTSSGVKGYIVNNLELIEYPQTFYENIYFDQFDKLKVDSQHNVWVITRHSGIRVISQDTSLWPTSEGINMQNSPILSDIIYDIAFNDNDGFVYFATEKGISVLETPFTENPNNELESEILLSPNPFRIYNNDFLSIWNLFAGSKVRIMTLNGLVIKTFELSDNENKINSWDGVLDNGKTISSGMYLVTASHPDYKSRVGKLAIIK